MEQPTLSPTLATAPYSQAILVDQPFGEEFLHALIHAGTEPIPFLWPALWRQAACPPFICG